MNENLKPTTLHQWLKQATKRLERHSTTPWLDAKVIAEHVLGKYWFWVEDEQVTKRQSLDRLERALSMREKGLPIAFITNQKEFYGRSFEVVANTTLIPRPETEELIEQLKTLNPKPGDKIIDVGTGSGVIAITIALEWPETKVLATDISTKALEVAIRNAKTLKAAVVFAEGDLLADSPEPSYNFIVANLPYVDKEWQRSPETSFEPAIALFANDNGLGLIKKLMTQAPSKLQSGGHLLLEADPRQHDAIIKFASKHNLEFVNQRDFALVFRQN